MQGLLALLSRQDQPAQRQNYTAASEGCKVHHPLVHHPQHNTANAANLMQGLGWPSAMVKDPKARQDRRQKGSRGHSPLLAPGTGCWLTHGLLEDQQSALAASKAPGGRQLCRSSPTTSIGHGMQNPNLGLYMEGDNAMQQHRKGSNMKRMDMGISSLPGSCHDCNRNPSMLSQG